MRPAERRAATLEELADRTFDLLVVGAGIVGCRVALDAASVGLSVALVDRGDIAGGTSSASSKFVHGGFRYLGMRSFGLVRCAQLERAALLRALPGLVRPMQMIVALEKRRYPRPVVAFGVSAYRCLGGSDTRTITADAASTLVPQLGPQPGRVLISLPEAQTDDARLTVATARAAADRGALVTNYVAVEGMALMRGRIAGAFVRDRLGGSDFLIRCRSVVNSSGAYVDELRALESPGTHPIARLSKGIHLVLPLEIPWHAGVACYSDNHRTTFAVPWQGMLLVGTTDQPYGRAEAVRVEPGEELSLLEAAAQLLPPELLQRKRIVFRFAGLRVLAAGATDTAQASREHIVQTGPAGMVSVAGGKLTLHRLIAREALARLPTEVRPRRLDPTLLPAGDDVAGPGEQIQRAIEQGWAVTVEDLVRRRTNLAVRGLDDAATRAHLRELLRCAGYAQNTGVSVQVPQTSLRASHISPSVT
ncbi:MAG TPA: glycerol-3-phosphate dehydrogenase/oxidase [Gaiellaceae bacterium]